MPRKHLFLCCECAGTDLSIKDEKSHEYRKTSTRVEVGQRVNAGDPKVSFILHLFRLGKFSPWNIFWRNYHLALGISEVTHMVLVYFYQNSENIIQVWSMMFLAQCPNPSPPIILLKPKSYSLDPAPGSNNNKQTKRANFFPNSPQPRTLRTLAHHFHQLVQTTTPSHQLLIIKPSRTTRDPAHVRECKRIYQRSRGTMRLEEARHTNHWEPF